MTDIKYFYLNNELYITYYSLTLLDLISYFNYNKSLFVVEYNGLICNQIKWNKISIQNQDKIEILSIVGGG